MKKLSLLMLSALVAFASCTKDVDTDSAASQEVAVSFTVQVPEVATRSAFDDDPTLKSMRLFVMISKNDVIVDTWSDEDWSLSNETPTFNLMTGVKYQVSAWADFGGDYYDVISAIGEEPSIKIAGTDSTIEMTSAYDAYFSTAEISFTTGTTVQALELSRPFSVVKITATDYYAAAMKNIDLQPTLTTYSMTVPTTLDLLTGEVSDSKELSFTNDITDNGEDAGSAEVAYTYILTSDESSLLTDFTQYYTKDDTDVAEYEFTSIPVQRNYITNITGNILTKNGDINISVDQKWEGTFTETGDVIVQGICLDELKSGSNSTYTITAEDVASYTDTPITLILQFINGGNDSTVTIEFESDEVAAMVGDLYVDLAQAEETVCVIVDEESFAGTIYLGDYYDIDEVTNLGTIDVNIPNGSLVIESGITVESVKVITASSTFILSEGATINGDLVVEGGRTIIDGTVTGNISVENGTVLIKDGDSYQTYATTGVQNLYYTQPVGFGVDIDDIIGLFDSSISISSLFDFGVNLDYAATVGVFDFNNSADGYDATKWKNIELSLESATGTSTATLKEDLDLSSAITSADIVSLLNSVIDKFDEDLSGEVDKLTALVESYQSVLPELIYEPLIEEIAKLQSEVDLFVEELPTVTSLDGYGVPVGTVIPCQDNFEIDDIVAIIGSPDDEISLTNISDYISGDKTISLYAIVNFFASMNEAEEEVETLTDEITALENEAALLQADVDALNAEIEGLVDTDVDLIALEEAFNQAVADYDALTAPATSGGGYIWQSTYWYISSATKNSDFSLIDSSTSYFGTTTLGITTGTTYSITTGSSNVSTTNLALMNAKNDQIAVINAAVAAYRAKLSELSGDLESDRDEAQDRLDEIGVQSDITTALDWLGINTSALTDGDTISSLLSLLGYDLDISDYLDGVTLPNIADYLYSGELGDLYLELYEAELTALIYTTAVEQLGISDDVISILLYVADYLEVAVEVLDQVNVVAVSIRDYNPWEYSYSSTSTTLGDVVYSSSVTLTFEFAEGQIISVINSDSEELQY